MFVQRWTLRHIRLVAVKGRVARWNSAATTAGLEQVLFEDIAVD